MTDTDILDRIDQAIGCQQCGGPLRNSPSDDFCTQECQQDWQAAHAAAPLDGDDAALVIPGRDTATWRAARTWRLPRQTGNLIDDIRACRAARLNATTPEQRAAVELRTAQLGERLNDQWRPIREQFEQMARHFAQAVEQFGRGLRAAMGIAEPPAPTGDERHDRMAAALAARRSRNTGPARRRGRPDDFALVR